MSSLNDIMTTFTPGETSLYIFPDLALIFDGLLISQQSVHPNTTGTQFYANALEAALAANP